MSSEKLRKVKKRTALAVKGAPTRAAGKPLTARDVPTQSGSAEGGRKVRSFSQFQCSIAATLPTLRWSIAAIGCRMGLQVF